MKGVTLRILSSVLPSFPYFFFSFNQPSLCHSFLFFFFPSLLNSVQSSTLPTVLPAVLCFLYPPLLNDFCPLFLPSFLPSCFFPETSISLSRVENLFHSLLLRRWIYYTFLAWLSAVPHQSKKPCPLNTIYISYHLIKYNVTQLHYNNLTVQLFDTFSEVIQFVLRLFKAPTPHPSLCFPCRSDPAEIFSVITCSWFLLGVSSHIRLAVKMHYLTDSFPLPPTPPPVSLYLPLYLPLPLSSETPSLSSR